jgi:hypothetical protein
MSFTVNQEHVSFADIFNVRWKEEVSESCHSQGLDGCRDKSIAWRDKQAIEWTNEKVEQVFSDCCPKGLDYEIMSILDRGYSIFVSDNVMNVRLIWIEKVDKKNEAIEPKEQRIFGRALQFESILKVGIDLFQHTLAIGKPYKYEDWFGQNKKYAPYVTGEHVADSRIDGFFALASHTMIFRKVLDNGYELEFGRDDIIKNTVISCKKFTIV